MEQEFDFNQTPTLTFEPFADEMPKTKEEVVEAKEVSVQKEKQPPVFDESSLTEEERQMVNDFASKIELGNSNLILQYGAGAQKKIADFSETALGNVKSKDLGEVGELLSGVVYELK